MCNQTVTMRFTIPLLVVHTCQILKIRLLWVFTHLATVQLPKQKVTGQTIESMAAITAAIHVIPVKSKNTTAP